ncbi:hypothetical protein P7228_00795 [Altererythrobacter arenosus]|uniref:Helix-turn-helix domain-containing protein n=1 Tax=Altererythrobacter arenosus TaxID=3032592 RepID=A0ABY8FRJ0_9SPHN|nr:hypothetical protein [Altererythrobacter sp. CAU 1644]WFL77633.1 hypothetical protein P7228_00795 [Altererythrobacter sp. CAU 1644]
MRIRADGWTPLRQAEFIGHLAETRSVGAAARAVGMARESAYRLRERPGAEGFCAAWDVAMARLGTKAGEQRWLAAQWAARVALRPHRKVTLAELHWRVDTGIWQVILRGGRYAGVRRKPDNSAVLALLGRVREPAKEYAA